MKTYQNPQELKAGLNYWVRVRPIDELSHEGWGYIMCELLKISSENEMAEISLFASDNTTFWVPITSLLERV